ncbi:MAG: McrC family protein [Rhodanobacteraceae bacterium]
MDKLVKRGLRFDYHRVREEQRFLQGRLDIARQLGQPPGRAHLFQIAHDLFDANRPENRLLCTALDCVFRLTRDGGNWRMAHELASLLSDIPRSGNIAADFRHWGNDRLLAHYRPARPWCELILSGQTPLSVLGEWHGISLLFPMERLFERYVGVCLRRTLPFDAQLTPTASSKYLCVHREENWFQLKPDVLLQRGGVRWVLDTKWKRLDATLGNTKDKYRLSQADFYQLFAYGHRYMDGKGDVFLVYPKTASFSEALPMFRYTDELRLWVVPFDLEEGAIVDGHRTALPFSLQAAA